MLWYKKDGTQRNQRPQNYDNDDIQDNVGGDYKQNPIKFQNYLDDDYSIKILEQKINSYRWTTMLHKNLHLQTVFSWLHPTLGHNPSTQFTVKISIINDLG